MHLNEQKTSDQCLNHLVPSVMYVAVSRYIITHSIINLLQERCSSDQQCFRLAAAGRCFECCCKSVVLFRRRCRMCYFCRAVRIKALCLAGGGNETREKRPTQHKTSRSEKCAARVPAGPSRKGEWCASRQRWGCWGWCTSWFEAEGRRCTAERGDKRCYQDAPAILAQSVEGGPHPK